MFFISLFACADANCTSSHHPIPPPPKNKKICATHTNISQIRIEIGPYVKDGKVKLPETVTISSEEALTKRPHVHTAQEKALIAARVGNLLQQVNESSHHPPPAGICACQERKREILRNSNTRGKPL